MRRRQSSRAAPPEDRANQMPITTAQQSSIRTRPLIWALTAGLIAIAVHLPGLRNDFVNWDDTAYLHNNPHMTEPDGLRRIWTTAESPQYYPLTFTSFWIEHKLWGFDPLAYHAVNVALHGVNAALVVLMLTALGMTAPAALVVALLFAVSPIQVMSVAWVAERKNVLSTVFGLVALAACWRWARTGGVGAYIGALIALTLALLSKTAWLVFPLIAAIGWLLVFRIPVRRVLVATIPFLALCTIAAIITWRMEAQFYPETRPGAVERVQIAAGALVFYLRTSLLPLDLYPFYPKWNVAPGEPRAWLPVGVLLVAAAILVALRRRIPPASAWGLATFVAFLLPVLGFVPFANMDLTWVSDHFAYDALIGLYAAVVVVAQHMLQRVSRGPRVIIGATLAGALAMAGAANTWRHIPVWKDAVSMWTRAAGKNPHSAVPHAGLGAAYIESRDYERAAVELQRAVQINPRDSHARAQLGFVLSRLGRLDHVDARLHLGAEAESRGDLRAALTEYRRAYQLDVTDLYTASALAGLLVGAHQIDEAQQIVERSLELHPDAPALLRHMGAILDARGRPEEAEELLRRAQLAAPGDAEIHYSLGVVLARQGRHDEAIECYEQAASLQPGVARYWNNLGATQLDAKQPEAAARSIRRALRVDPQDAVAWNNLGAALGELRRFDEAVDALQKAVDLAPSYPNARHRLGKTLADAGRHAEAVRSLDDGISAIGLPAAVGMANELARLLAACSDDAVRDAARALRLAQQVDQATRGTSWEALDTLAIAQAANGQFDRAVESETRALELARTAGATASIADIERRLASFKRGEPYVGR